MRTPLLLSVALFLLSGCTFGTLTVSSYGGESKDYRTRFDTPIVNALVLNGDFVFGDTLSEVRKHTFVWINHGVSGVFIEE